VVVDGLDLAADLGSEAAVNRWADGVRTLSGATALVLAVWLACGAVLVVVAGAVTELWH
jgi:hypothetical protein